MITREDIARAIEPYLRIYVATLTGGDIPLPGATGPLVDYIEALVDRVREEEREAIADRLKAFLKDPIFDEGDAR